MDIQARTQIGRYRLVKVIGRSEIATTYQADDTRLERKVALKLLNQSGRYTPEFGAYFLAEAQKLAQLAHPNIARILDVGQEDGLLFVVEEFVEGQTLTERLGRPVEWREATQVILPVLDALHYAHERGIIHRDLKPENILIDAEQRPVVCDFSIARMVEEEETRDATSTNAGLGSPYYMSPEQGRGLPVDTRADLYSAGIIFYELVTGHKPFEGGSGMEVLIQQVSARPPSPRKHAGQLPSAVEQTILTALEKDPDERFQTALEMAEAVRATLEGGRRRSGPKRKGGSARSRAIAWLAGGLLILLLGLAGLVLAWVSGRLPMPPALAGMLTRTTGLTPAGLATPLSEAQVSSNEPTIAIPIITGTSTEEPALSEPTRTPFPPTPTPRGAAAATATATPVLSGEFPYTIGQGLLGISTQPLTVETIGQIRELARWGTPKLEAFVWTPDDRFLVGATSAGLYFFAADRPALPLVRAFASPGWLTAVAASPDGKWIATGDRSGLVQVWDADSGEVISDLVGPVGRVNDLAFSPDGAWLASGGDDFSVFVWDLASGALRYEKKLSKSVTGVAFSLDGQFLTCSSADFNNMIWLAESGEKAERAVYNSGSPANDVAFTSRRQMVVGLQNAALVRWDYDSGKIVKTIKENGQVSAVLALAVSPKEELLAGGSQDGSLRVWNLESGNLLWKFPQKGPAPEVALVGVRFSNDGQRLAGLSEDGLLRIWQLQSEEIVSQTQMSFQEIKRAAIFPDGRSMLLELNNQVTLQWSLDTGSEEKKYPGRLPRGQVISPDGSRFVVLNDNKLRVYGADGLPGDGYLIDWPFPPGSAVAFTPDSIYLGVGFGLSSLKVWNYVSSREVPPIPQKYWTGRDNYRHCTLWHDQNDRFRIAGTILGVFTDDETARFLCEINRGQSVKDEDFLPGGDFLAFSRTDMNRDKIELWKRGGLKPVMLDAGDEGQVQILTVALSPDGALVASADGTGRVHVWSTENSAQPVFSMQVHAGAVNDIAFSGDGRLLVTVSDDGTAQVWGVAP